MKYKVFLLAACIATFFGFSSCGDNESKWKDFAKGTWKLTELKLDGRWENVENKVDASITFLDDNTYRGKGAFGNGEGTYKLEGDTLFTYVAGKEYMHYVIKYADDESANLELWFKGEKLDIHAKREK
jgi:hypothetical protein